LGGRGETSPTGLRSGEAAEKEEKGGGEVPVRLGGGNKGIIVSSAAREREFLKAGSGLMLSERGIGLLSFFL